jgi:hypothetical protein
MKNLLFGLFIFLSLQSFTQSNFRGMSWGDTPQQLKSNYPDVQFETMREDELFISYVTEDIVGGLNAIISYHFKKDKLLGGTYYFQESHQSDNMYYEDFKIISNILNDKYIMEPVENWNNTTFKNRPNDIGFALKMGHVEIAEMYLDKQTSIVHTIASVTITQY